MSPKTVLTLIAVTFALVLTACGDDDGGAGRASSAVSSADSKADVKLTKWARELIEDENCDPAIARELSPHEAEHGECRMPTFTDICGEGNFEEGLALIDQIYESSQAGRNPWLMNCARRQNATISLQALCRGPNMRQSTEVCECVADRTLAEVGDADKLRWYVLNEVGYFDGWMEEAFPDGRYPSKDTSNDATELYGIRSAAFNKMRDCMG